MNVTELLDEAERLEREATPGQLVVRSPNEDEYGDPVGSSLCYLKKADGNLQIIGEVNALFDAEKLAFAWDALPRLVAALRAADGMAEAFVTYRDGGGRFAFRALIDAHAAFDALASGGEEGESNG